MEFDGIDLSKLENSESPILNLDGSEGSEEDTTGTKKPDSSASTPEATTEEGGEETEGLDPDVLANLIGENDNNDTAGSKIEDGETKNLKAPSDDGKASSSSQNTFTSLASALNEEGALDISEEDLATVTDADTLLKVVLDKVKDNSFEELNDNQKEYLTAMKAGVPHDTYASHKGNADQYSNITDEQIGAKLELQAELIKRSFLINGVDMETATKYADIAMKSDSSLDDAVKAKNALVAFENGKLQEEINARKQEQETAQATSDKELAELKSKVTESSEVIPGIKINSTTKDKVFTSMTTPVSQDEQGNPLNAVMDKYANDPAYKMKLHTLHEITKGFTDFSKLTKTFKSDAAKTFEKQIENNNIKTGSSMKSADVVSASQLSMKEAIDKLEL